MKLVPLVKEWVLAWAITVPGCILVFVAVLFPSRREDPTWLRTALLIGVFAGLAAPTLIAAGAARVLNQTHSESKPQLRPDPATNTTSHFASFAKQPVIIAGFVSVLLVTFPPWRAFANADGIKASWPVGHSPIWQGPQIQAGPSGLYRSIRE